MSLRGNKKVVERPNLFIRNSIVLSSNDCHTFKMSFMRQRKDTPSGCNNRLCQMNFFALKSGENASRKRVKPPIWHSL